MYGYGLKIRVFGVISSEKSEFYEQKPFNEDVLNPVLLQVTSVISSKNGSSHEKNYNKFLEKLLKKSL